MTRANTPRILVIGGGHLGLYAAGRLQERLRPGEANLIRQARRLADNLIAGIRHERTHPPRPYRHNFRGYVAGLGRLQGVACSPTGP